MATEVRLIGIIYLLLSSFFDVAWSQSQKQDQRLRVLFYNVENLFDTYDDPLTNDDEFTLKSIRRWDSKKYAQKCNHIGQVIAAAGEWGQVEIIGLCEVENDTVLRRLTHYSALREAGYSFVSTHSRDPRGIDVALLYQRECFRLIADTFYRTALVPPTRDVLHVTGVIPTGDTLHLIVAHLPSKRGGAMSSHDKRGEVMRCIGSICQSIQRQNAQAKILVMGDFNDQADRLALISPFTMIFERPFQQIVPYYLYALLPPTGMRGQGSYKYKESWSNIDQFLVSGSLLQPNASPFVKDQKATIFSSDFLLTDDLQNGGKRPFSTYHGMRYIGGYSDHLPIFLDLIITDRVK